VKIILQEIDINFFVKYFV